MKKKFFACLALALVLAIGMSLPALAYQPIIDGAEDIRWFGGYIPASGRSVITEVSDGVHVAFKKDPEMWANRVVVGFDYDMSDNDSGKIGKKPSEEGLYIRLKDIKWNVPKPNPTEKEPYSSLMITLCATQGGWSDGRALMFWIRKSHDGKCILGILRGFDGDETNRPSQFVLDPNYVELPDTIDTTLDFWLHRTDSKTWTVNINGNSVKLDDKTQVSERFVAMNKLAVSLGTWSSSASVECVVNDIWHYKCIEYDAANPPAYVKTVRANASKPATTTTTKAAGKTDKPDTKTTAAAVGTTGTKQNDASNTDPDTTDPISSPDASDPVSAPDGSATGSSDIQPTQTNKADPADGENKGGTGWVVWLVVGLIAVVLIGGGLAFWLLFLRKPNDTAPKN